MKTHPYLLRALLPAPFQRHSSALAKYLLVGGMLLASLTACQRPAVEPRDPMDNPPPDSQEPSPFFLVTASIDKGLSVSLKWPAQAGNPTYRILRATADLYSDPDKVTYEKVGETNGLSFDDTQVTPNSIYFYKVQAHYGGSKTVNSPVAVGRTLQPSNEELAALRYTQLGDATGGKRNDADSPAALLETIIQIIQQQAGNGKADVVLLVDDTSSMGDDINAVKAGLNRLISALPTGTRLGAATYNDLNEEPTTWYALRDLTTDYAGIRTFINAIRCRGGADLPESVYDGVYETLTRVSWANAKRIVIVVGDDRPLEGSRTKHSYDEVVAKCKQAGVEANLYPILIKEENNQQGE